MKHSVTGVFIRVLFISFLVVLSVGAKSVNSSDAGKSWLDYDVKIVRPSKKPPTINQFGGSAKHKVAASGYFRVIKKSNTWWMVDPEGCLFLSIGLNSVQPERVGSYDEESWANTTYSLMKEAGFNTMGRWSSPDCFEAVGTQVPWCSTLSFMKEYARNRPSKNGQSGFPNETLPVFDKEWPEFCQTYAVAQTSHLLNDKWLLGHYSDNELLFRPNALEKYLDLPVEDAGHQAALEWMRQNKVRKSDVDDPREQAAFLEVVAQRYFDTVGAALKKADPNHLFIGSRLHGRSINESVMRGSRACDIISINYYHRWEPEKKRIAQWAKWSGRPFLVSEFYAMKVDSRATVADGAGFRVLNHQDAGFFYHTYVGELLKNAPSCVGWHWFKYADAYEDAGKGVVGMDGKPHTVLLESMKTLNDQAYTVRGAR